MSLEEINWQWSFILLQRDQIIGSAISFPLERNRLILQTQRINKSIPLPDLQGFRSSITTLIKQEGIRSLWRGNSLFLLRLLSRSYFNWEPRRQIRNLFPKYSQKRDYFRYSLIRLTEQFVSGAILLGIVYPMDNVCTRLAVDRCNIQSQLKYRYQGIIHCFQDTFQTTGFRGVYAGYVPGLLRFVFYHNYLSNADDFLRRYIYFPSSSYNNFLRKYATIISGSELSLTFKEWKTRLNLLAQIMSNLGFIALAHFTTYPLDTISRTMMILYNHQQKSTSSLQFVRSSQSMVYCIEFLFRGNGWKGFFPGFGTSLTQHILTYLLIVYARSLNN
jgi:solute carrier family 25 (mitochondrial adenine nucleotide translocator), member 4/5/6/31